MAKQCKFCGSGEYVKNGIVYGLQRYRCKSCKKNYREGDKRQKYTMNDRLKVIKLYLENCGIRTIERLTGIHNSQISSWIEDGARYVQDKLDKSRNSTKSLKDIEIMEIDELCIYIKKDQRMVESSPLYGLLLIENRVKLLILK
jgi:transposase